MSIDVLLVDDSAVIRKLLVTALQKYGDIRVVATAIDGSEAVRFAKQHQPHIIILDVEMPKMDGLSALPLLLEAAPKTRIIMASRLTHKNAKASLDALARGASDYIPKPEIDNLDAFYRELLEKVRALAPSSATGAAKSVRVSPPTGAVTTPAPAVNMPHSNTSGTSGAATEPFPTAPQPARVIPTIRTTTKQPIHAVAIAASTGGPQALISLLTDLGGLLTHVPVFITQHMPATFTPIFAEHLTLAGKNPCVEGKEGEVVKAGHVYVAPGDYHMLAERSGGQVIIRNNQQAAVHFCRPAADPMFQSLAEVYGANLLAVVLTGMGQDGANGAEIIAQRGGVVVAQDAASCVVYGMPRAVAEKGVCQEILPLNKIAPYILKRCSGS